MIWRPLAYASSSQKTCIIHNFILCKLSNAIRNMTLLEFQNTHNAMELNLNQGLNSSIRTGWYGPDGLNQSLITRIKRNNKKKFHPSISNGENYQPFLSHILTITLLTFYAFNIHLVVLLFLMMFIILPSLISFNCPFVL